VLLEGAFRRYDRSSSGSGGAGRKRERPGSISLGGDAATPPPPSTPGFYSSSSMDWGGAGPGGGGRRRPLVSLSLELLVTYEGCNPKHRFRFKVRR
jgi:hypothetical protein